MVGNKTKTYMARTSWFVDKSKSKDVYKDKARELIEDLLSWSTDNSRSIIIIDPVKVDGNVNILDGKLICEV